MSSLFTGALVFATCVLVVYLHWYAPRAAKRLRMKYRAELEQIAQGSARRVSMRQLPASAALVLLAQRLECADGLPVITASALASETVSAWSAELLRLAAEVRRLELAQSIPTVVSVRAAVQPRVSVEPLTAEAIDALLESPPLPSRQSAPAEESSMPERTQASGG